jgi:hypothetical protein
MFCHNFKYVLENVTALKKCFTFHTEIVSNEIVSNANSVRPNSILNGKLATAKNLDEL